MGPGDASPVCVALRASGSTLREVNLKLKDVVTVIWNSACFPEEVRLIFYKGGKMFCRLSKQTSVVDTV